MKQVKAILLGAGLRGGKVYAEYALEYPNELKIVAVAEPDPLRWQKNTICRSRCSLQAGKRLWKNR